MLADTRRKKHDGCHKQAVITTKVARQYHRRRNNFLIGGARNFSESSHPQIKLLTHSSTLI